VLDPHSANCTPQYLDEMIEEFEKYTTMMYRPPEMIDRYKKFKVDTQADVWMLGCVIYSLCFF
jgi:AP2-associated kinase